MKSSVRKYLAALATVVLLMLVLLPHHHHEGGAFCVSVQMCQKDFATQLAHDNMGGGFGGNDGFGGGTPLCLSPDFWNNHYFYSYLSGTNGFVSANAALLAGCNAKHWKRRGPPTLVVL